jgi:HSP20 family protein
MREDMDRTFGQFFGPSALTGRGGEWGQQMWSPNVDISEDDKEWTVEIDLPGVERDNVQVEVDHSQLRIRAEMRQETQNQPQQEGQQNQPARQYHQRERQYGYFERTFTLPDNVDEENVRCDFRNGVLTCHLPKTGEPSYRGRRIPISGDAQTATPGQSGSRQATAASPAGQEKQKK